MTSYTYLYNTKGQFNGVEIWGTRRYVLDNIACQEHCGPLIAMNLDIVHDYNLLSVAIRLFEAGNQKFSNKLIKLNRVASHQM